MNIWIDVLIRFIMLVLVISFLGLILFLFVEPKEKKQPPTPRKYFMSDEEIRKLIQQRIGIEEVNSEIHDGVCGISCSTCSNTNVHSRFSSNPYIKTWLGKIDKETKGAITK